MRKNVCKKYAFICETITIAKCRLFHASSDSCDCRQEMADIWHAKDCIEWLDFMYTHTSTH